MKGGAGHLPERFLTMCEVLVIGLLRRTTAVISARSSGESDMYAEMLLDSPNIRTVVILPRKAVNLKALVNSEPVNGSR